MLASDYTLTKAKHSLFPERFVLINDEETPHPKTMVTFQAQPRRHNKS